MFIIRHIWLRCNFSHISIYIYWALYNGVVVTALLIEGPEGAMCFSASPSSLFTVK